jgi:hypothetical protein
MARKTVDLFIPTAAAALPRVEPKVEGKLEVIGGLMSDDWNNILSSQMRVLLR